MHKTIFTLLISLFWNFTIAQEHNSYHQALVNQVNSTNIINYLTEFEDFGIKTLGSEAQQNTLNWLINHYQNWGYTDIETQQVSAFGYTGYNLIVTKKGTVYPDTYIIIDAHYDTINGPGTNDNGSGTSILLEIARILAQVKSEYSIKFIHFTAEEWGLIGSQQYVEEIVIPEDLDIKLVFNIDEVGGVAGMDNNLVVCEQDESSPHYNDGDSSIATIELANCMELYSDLGTVFNYAYSSDYMPFQQEGFVITGLYEFNESPYPHTSQDVLVNMDTEYVYQIAKGSLGALAYFAKVFQDLSVKDEKEKKMTIYPNPVNRFLQIQSQNTEAWVNYQLIDTSGKVVLKTKKKGNQDFQWDISSLSNGVYILKSAQFSQKIIVQHK